jgi:hypothetical protein
MGLSQVVNSVVWWGMAAVIAGLLWIISGVASIGWLLWLHCTGLDAQHFGDLSQPHGL